MDEELDSGKEEERTRVEKTLQITRIE